MLNSSQTKFKLRKPPITRSCDSCRRRKTRCDGLNMPGNHCSNCLAFGDSCTYMQQPVKRGPKSKLDEDLQQKCRLIEELKQRIDVLEARPPSSICSLCTRPLHIGSQDASSPKNPSEYNRGTESPTPEEEDTEISEELSAHFRKISLRLKGFSSQPFGLASNVMFVKTALAIKEKYQGYPSSSTRFMRPIYWEQTPWEKEFYDQQPSYIYPEDDLVSSLLELYFINVHPTLPVLHRGSFERQVEEGLHLTNTKFGGVLLAVLAVASRYSDDPRVMVDGNTLSSGWPFVTQLQAIHNFFEVTIHDLQFHCLMVLFWMGTSAPHTGWLYLGLAIRFLQYRGDHDRKRDGTKAEDELWNRAFWSIFILDRMVSTFIGRPPAIHREDYYVDPPLEVDDEYWDHGFIQPLGKPSALSFFVYLVRLVEIMGDALRRLHTHPKLKLRMGINQQEIVAELDSLMNDFSASIPPHLRWDQDKDPNREDVFFDQAAMLHATYCYVQIIIHRPFIRKPAPLAAPSLFICITAARAELNVAELWSHRLKRVAPPFLQNPMFAAAVVLLVNVFSTQRARIAMDFDKDMALVRAAMNVLHVAETRWHFAGRRWELLQELQSLRVPPKNEVDHDASANSRLGESTEGRAPTSHGAPEQQNFLPGTSIEQLLEETGWNKSSELQDELMSMWLAAPADLMEIDRWDLYIGNMTSLPPHLGQ